MKAVAEKLDNNRVSLEIEVPAERVEAALERAYRKFVREVNIPGFRKGKAPRRIVEARFGVEVLYEDALEELLPEAYREALNITKVEAIDEPSLSDVHIEAGSPLRFRAEVEVMPDAELGEYKGLKVEKEIESVEEGDIDHALWHLQEESAQLVAVDRTAVEEGDHVTIDFEAFVDGKPFQGGAAKGYSLEVGSGSMIPGFEEQLVGAEVGQPKEFTVKFPDDYPREDLKGKDVLFKVTVQGIKVRQVPELDDEFAADVSDVSTLEELRAQIRKEMEEDARERADREVRNKLVDALTDSSSVEVPRVLVEREMNGILEDFALRLLFRGTSFARYLEETGQTEEEVREQARTEAERRAKATVVLQTLVKREGIAVSEEELQARIEEIVAANGNSERIRQELESPEGRERLRSSMLVEKAVDFLVEHADIEEKFVPSRGHGHHHHHDDQDDEYDHDHDEDGEDHDDLGGDSAEEIDDEDDEDDDEVDEDDDDDDDVDDDDDDVDEKD